MSFAPAIILLSELPIPKLPWSLCGGESPLTILRAKYCMRMRFPYPFLELTLQIFPPFQTQNGQTKIKKLSNKVTCKAHPIRDEKDRNLYHFSEQNHNLYGSTFVCRAGWYGEMGECNYYKLFQKYSGESCRKGQHDFIIC